MWSISKPLPLKPTIRFTCAPSFYLSMEQNKGFHAFIEYFHTHGGDNIGVCKVRVENPAIEGKFKDFRTFDTRIRKVQVRANKLQDDVFYSFQHEDVPGFANELYRTVKPQLYSVSNKFQKSHLNGKNYRRSYKKPIKTIEKKSLNFKNVFSLKSKEKRKKTEEPQETCKFRKVDNVWNSQRFKTCDPSGFIPSFLSENERINLFLEKFGCVNTLCGFDACMEERLNPNIPGWDFKCLDAGFLDAAILKYGEGIGGVSSPHVYFGTSGSYFTIQDEDFMAGSVNYLLEGSPKVWWIVAPGSTARLLKFLEFLFPEMFKLCPDFLRHKCIMIGPDLLRSVGIDVIQVIQRPGDIVITLPSAIHFGFNMGDNVCVSVNWLSPLYLSSTINSYFCHYITQNLNFEQSSFSPYAVKDTNEFIKLNPLPQWSSPQYHDENDLISFFKQSCPDHSLYSDFIHLSLEYYKLDLSSRECELLDDIRRAKELAGQSLQSQCNPTSTARKIILIPSFVTYEQLNDNPISTENNIYFQYQSEANAYESFTIPSFFANENTARIASDRDSPIYPPLIPLEHYN